MGVGARLARRVCLASGVILAAAVGLRAAVAQAPVLPTLARLTAPAAALLAPQEDDAALPPQGGSLPPLSAPAESPSPAPADDGAYPVVPVTIDPSDGSGYVTAGGVYLKNQTAMTIDLRKALTLEPELTLAADAPQVLIIHTHGTESYLDAAQSRYDEEDLSRSTDPEKNVLRVGRAMKDALTRRGLSVVHDETLYDSPSYAGSYTRALEGIRRALAEHPTIQVVIDVHRDALQEEDQTMYNTVTEIDGQPTAQVMLVMGTDGGGLSHPGWKSNLRLAARIQQEMERRYPTLARPISLRDARFNQHMTPGSLLVEVGTAVSTMDEALRAGELFAQCAAEVLLGYVE